MYERRRKRTSHAAMIALASSSTQNKAAKFRPDGQSVVRSFSSNQTNRPNANKRTPNNKHNNGVAWPEACLRLV